jgi:hypothetical protein
MRAFICRLLCLAWLAVLTPAPASAEQFERINGYQAHYSVVPTTFLKPAVAADYDIVRARDRALVNIAVIDPGAGPVPATVSGTVTDLLGNTTDLDFREVREGEAIYYLATARHGDEETLRFRIDVSTPDAGAHQLAFQQKLYWNEP